MNEVNNKSRLKESAFLVLFELHIQSKQYFDIYFTKTELYLFR